MILGWRQLAFKQGSASEREGDLILGKRITQCLWYTHHANNDTLTHIRD
jgi:hypothetical protein